ncbi:MAG: hypothetical protein LQ347_001509 [Umbilicaria vellea]|nr:MAG: hypothetical protein LQ347_001509 [Umbilicaria vellea]
MSVPNQSRTESPHTVDQRSTGAINVSSHSFSVSPTVPVEDPIDPEDRIFDPAEIPASITSPPSTLLSTNTLSTTSLPIASPPIPSPPSQLQTTASSNTTHHADRARQAEYQARRVAALRRELSRMRSGIERVMSGLQELGENIPDSQDAVRRSANLDIRLQVLQERLTSTPSLANVGATLNHTAYPDTRTNMNFTAEPLPQLPGILDLVRNDPHMSIQQRLEAARDAEGWTRRQREHAAVRLEALESEAQAATDRRRQIEREIRMQEQNARIFGTREEVERQGAEYESPIGGMFRRAYARYGDREEERRQEQLLQQIIEAEERVLANDDAAERNQPDRRRPEGPLSLSAAPMDRTVRSAETFFADEIETPEHRRERLRTLGWTMEPLQQQHPIRIGDDTNFPHLQDPARGLAARRYGQFASMRRRAAAPFDPHDPELEMDDMDEDDSSENVEEERAGLDKNDGRPAPKTDEEMMVKSECKICYGQLATVAVLPCGKR